MVIMKMDISISAKQLACLPVQQRRFYYRLKITQHSPPKTEHDKFMLKIYGGLLDDPDDSRALERIDQELLD
jgi:hypothetical protein